MGMCVGLETNQIENIHKWKIKLRSDESPLSWQRHIQMVKDHDLRVFIWKVCFLNWKFATAQLVDVLISTGTEESGFLWNIHSGYIKKHKFDVGFVVEGRLRRRILAFRPMDKRLATIRIKTKSFDGKEGQWGTLLQPSEWQCKYIKCKWWARKPL